MRQRARLGVLAGMSAVALATLAAAPAKADVSSWIFVGAGPSVFDYSLDGESQAALDIITGLGTSPAHPFVIGGVGRILPHLGDGVDLSLALRGATRGYVNGGFGLSLDAGGYQRWWGQESTGWIANVSGGLPWGMVLNASVAGGTNDARMVIVSFGIDFARLTVHRTAGENWWQNPFPSAREQ